MSTQRPTHAIKKIAACALLAAAVGIALPPDADTTADAPYYMCFAYTEDGMIFAGGDFSFRRAQRMIGVNCGLPKRVTVVLLKTIMMRKNGNTHNYLP